MFLRNSPTSLNFRFGSRQFTKKVNSLYISYQFPNKLTLVINSRITLTLWVTFHTKSNKFQKILAGHLLKLMHSVVMNETLGRSANFERPRRCRLLFLSYSCSKLTGATPTFCAAELGAWLQNILSRIWILIWTVCSTPSSYFGLRARAVAQKWAWQLNFELL